jgi:hypothetical protein
VRNKDLEKLKSKIRRAESSWNSENYLAFYLAKEWPVQITPEQAFLALKQKKLLIRPAAITEELIKSVYIRIRKDPGITLEGLEQELNVNRYELCWALYRYRRERIAKRSKASTGKSKGAYDRV